MIDEMFGKQFGRLIVLPIERKVKNKYIYLYYCKCNCGNEKWIRKNSLVGGFTQSCGCLNKERTKESNLIDLSGQRFGRLTVLSYYGLHSSSSKWLCKCDCGKEIITTSNSLRVGNTQSCGCLWQEVSHREKYIDLTGKKYNKLLILSYCGTDDKKQTSWLCRCDCGKEIVLLSCHFKSGNTKSCGCYNRELGSQRLNKYNQEYRISKGRDPNILISTEDEADRTKFKDSGKIQEILKRDNHTCQFCPDIHEDLEVHHILTWSEYPELRYENTNLITLCKICHVPIIHNNNPKFKPSDQTTQMLQDIIKRIYNA